MKTINISLFCLSLWMLAFGCGSENRQEQATAAKQQELQADTVFSPQTNSSEQSWDNKIDSMLQLAAKAEQDTNLAQLYINIGELYANNDFEKAKEYYLHAGNLSEKLNWNEGRYKYASGFFNILHREGLVDSSLVIIRHAYNLAKKENNEAWIAKTSMNMGVGYFYKSWHETTLQYFQEALHILEKQQTENNKETLIKLYDNSGVLYRIMGLPEKAIEYDKKALALFGEEEPLLKGTVLYNLATACHINKDEKTEYYFKEALRICELHNNKYVMAAIYLGLGSLVLPNDLKEAENYTRKALDICTEINNPNQGGLANLSLGLIELCRDNVKQAEQYSVTALQMAQQIGYAEYQVNAYRQLATLYAMQHDFANYMKSSIQADSIERVMARTATLHSGEEMKAKYETEKKELKISALEAQKRWMTWLSIAGGVVLLLVLTVFFFLWRWTVQKKRLAETQIKQFEQEKQLVATQSILDGETRERTRLARDLHDGLGSMLTGIRLNLQEMKSGAAMVYADVERFDKALELLDESVREMRRVSHHLMPDSLSRFGLKPAVDDFCRNFSSAVTFDYFGDETRLDPKLEVVIYRCIHELVNNAMKHSGASQIMVQIMQEPDRIAFTVQDDGCGFDLSAETKGTGLQNIRTRIASFGGNFQIDSQKNRGTEVNAEFQLKVTNYK